MSESLNKISLTHFASTVADILGIGRPVLADAPVQWAVEAMGDICKEKYDRAFIMNPDCCAQWLFEKYPDALFPVLRNTQVTIPFRTVMPSVTPVCFATMYTGVLPVIHGIQKYEKPVVKVDSLFDSWFRAGKKVALIVTPQCSMSLIFKDRNMDMFVVSCEGEGVEKARELIVADNHDVVILYTINYDTKDHKFGPEARESIAALYQQGAEFDMLVSDIRRFWKKHNTFISFSTDHGCHACEPSKYNKYHLGDHGTASPLDLNILHFMGAVLKADN